MSKREIGSEVESLFLAQDVRAAITDDLDRPGISARPGRGSDRAALHPESDPRSGQHSAIGAAPRAERVQIEAQKLLLSGMVEEIGNGLVCHSDLRKTLRLSRKMHKAQYLFMRGRRRRLLLWQRSKQSHHPRDRKWQRSRRSRRSRRDRQM